MKKDEQHFRNEMVNRLGRLTSYMQLNAPKNLIANELSGLFRVGLGFCGQELATFISKWLIADVRRSYGFCRNCANLALKNGLCVQCDNTPQGEEEFDALIQVGDADEKPR